MTTEDKFICNSIVQLLNQIKINYEYKTEYKLFKMAIDILASQFKDIYIECLEKNAPELIKYTHISMSYQLDDFLKNSESSF